MVSSLGADAKSRVFYNRVKGETEDALRVLGFDTLGIFRPSLLLGRHPPSRFGENIAATLLAFCRPLLVGGWRKYRAIEAEVVARAIVRSAKRAAGGAQVCESDEIQRLGE